MLLGEGYNFLGTHFWRGQDFGAVNLREAKIFGPSLLKQYRPPPLPSPPPQIVNDRSLTTVFYFILFFWPDSGVCWQHRQEYYRL